MMRIRILWSKAILFKFLLSLMWLNSAPVTAQGALEEVIVTAQKREESLQDVSISMTALSGDMIKALGLQDSLEVFNQIPNVFADQGSYSGGLTIRGNATLNTPPLFAEEWNGRVWLRGIKADRPPRIAGPPPGTAIWRMQAQV